jgi:chemotaxis protein CheX
MQQYKPELVEITERVWDSLFDVPLVPRDPGDPLGRSSGRAISGCVHITGAWEGAVTLHCSETLAKLVTGAMFEMEPAEASDDDVRDALGELANMVGGNVKALLPEPCRISLPAVADGADYRLSVPGTFPVTAVTWTCGGEPLMVRLLERDTGSAQVGGRTVSNRMVAS